MTVRTTYLELTDPARIGPGRTPLPGTRLERFLRPAPDLSQPDFETWVLWGEGAPAGYFELDATAPPEVEIASLGLLPGWSGGGLGGWMLSQALRRGLAPANYLARGMTAYRTEESRVEPSTEPSVQAPPPG